MDWKGTKATEHLKEVNSQKAAVEKAVNTNQTDITKTTGELTSLRATVAKAPKTVGESEAIARAANIGQALSSASAQLTAPHTPLSSPQSEGHTSNLQSRP